MQNLIAWLYGKKTYFVAAGAALTAIGAYLSKSITLTELVQALFGAAGLTTTRAAIAKGQINLLIIGAVLALSLGAAMAGVDTTTPLDPTGNAPIAGAIPAAPPTTANWESALITELENATANNLINVDIAPLLAPKLQATQKWGVDLDINHPVGNYGEVGVRFRYFNGDTYAGGVGVGFKDTFRIQDLITVQPYAGAGELNSVKKGGGVQPIAFAETGAKIIFLESKTNGKPDGNWQLFGLGGIEYDSNLPGVQIFRAALGGTLALGKKPQPATTTTL